MKTGQWIAILILACFYAAYFAKMLLQKKRGIQTHQIAKGRKSPQAMAVEWILSVATLAIVPAELLSILWDARRLTSKYLQPGGLIMAAAGVGLFIAAMATMRDSWRAGISESEKTQLITAGVYRFSRNPAFVGFDLMYLGILIAFPNGWLLFFTLFAVGALHLQILQEEAWLEKAFPKEYPQYRAAVGRYFSLPPLKKTERNNRVE